MSTQKPYPMYVPRAAEQSQIIAEVAKVRADGQSRAILLYGRGGTGKTRLVRQLPEIYRDQKVVWLDPVDVDDSQHWLLSNLEQYFATSLDPDCTYFGPYLDYVSQLPRHRLTPTSRETILDHLNRIKAVFTQCYKAYIEGTGHTVVMTFDTVEAIRGMYLLRTLTRWMKALPQTLFILAGRSGSGSSDWAGPMMAALADPSPSIGVTAIQLAEFNLADCREYLAPISKRARLSADEVESLVHLTQGHPLWLAFTVDYLTKIGLPEQAQDSLDKIRAELPYHGEASAAGDDRVESFKRSLVVPYREADFWHEAVKRLAVVRESISKPMWLQLMSGTPMPEDAPEPDQAWARLGEIEWIRPRANRRYVTLHDAVAEELAQRVIDLHDFDKQWRKQIWDRAAEIYAEAADEQDRRVQPRQAEMDSRFRAMDAAKNRTGKSKETSLPNTTAIEAELIRDVAELDQWQQELNQLRTAHLFYLLLSDFDAGVEQFVRLLHQASASHDVLFEDMLAFQMQRFLPGGGDQSTLGDTVGEAIADFRNWLSGDGQGAYVNIGLEMASYLIDREQPQEALSLLGSLPEPADHVRRYRFHTLQGNACMRVPGRVRDGGARFAEALAEASQMPGSDQYRFTSKAHKGMGFFNRQLGHWADADAAYEQARDAILQVLAPDGPQSDREEIASIYNNWAYVKGIGGKYEDGVNLIESAISIRKRLGRRHEQAISYSVKGEVYRYHRRFREAWQAYAEAEQLFGETSWSWRGVIYQEQAICLFQSTLAGVQLLTPSENPAEKARDLILEALELCRSLNIRAYPSALNRAGRIFGSIDPDLGISYLDDGATWAMELSDGWFLLANLIESAELCYRSWEEGGDTSYLEHIPAIAERLQAPQARELHFPELRGRWDVLQGHLTMRAGLDGNTDMFDVALKNYREGFPLIMHGWVGSYGASAIPAEFSKFSDLAWQLPVEVRVRWLRELRQAWSGQGESATQLLARLAELY